MGVKLYQSTDTSAPVLTGQTGSLINVLKKCLIDGYGSKTPPGTGWTGVFNAGYTKGTFRPQLGTRFYLWLDDSGSATGGARWARCRGVEAYDSLDGNGDLVNPTALFPTVAQLATPPNFYKSSTADATARWWAVVADEYCFWLFTKVGYSTGSTYANVFFFGDVVPIKSDDGFHSCLLANTLAETASPGLSSNYQGGAIGAAGSLGTIGTAKAGMYFARDFDQVAKSPTGSHFSPSIWSTATAAYGVGGLTYPHILDNSILLAPIYVSSIGGSGATVRGLLPGTYSPFHAATAMQDLGEYANLTGLPDKTLKLFLHCQGNAIYGGTFIDITGPWR